MGVGREVADIALFGAVESAQPEGLSLRVELRDKADVVGTRVLGALGESVGFILFPSLSGFDAFLEIAESRPAEQDVA